MERAEENPDANITRIAGKKTCEEWKVFTQKEKSEAFWQEAYNDYFLERLKTRYLNPIAEIEKLSDPIEQIRQKKKERGKEMERDFPLWLYFALWLNFWKQLGKGKNSRS